MTDEQYQEAFRKHQEEAQREQAETARLLNQAHRQAAEVQQELNNRPRRKYAAIVAVDNRGGFSKDGQIPWHYPADFKWFQSKTKGHICVMGRTTYDDIDKRLGEKAAENVLPNRRSFVVTSRPLERSNATPVASIGAIDIILDRDNELYDKTIFFCGGWRIYNEGMAKVDRVYMTVINKEFDCDINFPKKMLTTDFGVLQIESQPDQPDLKFITFGRHGT